MLERGMIPSPWSCKERDGSYHRAQNKDGHADVKTKDTDVDHFQPNGNASKVGQGFGLSIPPTSPPGYSGGPQLREEHRLSPLWCEPRMCSCCCRLGDQSPSGKKKRKARKKPLVSTFRILSSSY